MAMDHENRTEAFAEEKHQVPFIEHAHRRIKRFKILQVRCRKKQKKHLLRVSLVCGNYNDALDFEKKK